MRTRMRAVHAHNSVQMKKKDTDTQDCRSGGSFALFHIVNLRRRVATSHVWMCTVYVLICLGSRRGGAECVPVLRYQSCWTYLAPHRVSKQTRGSPFKHACRVGWAGCTPFFFFPFSPEQLYWLHFHVVKANTQPKWHDGSWGRAALRGQSLGVICAASRLRPGWWSAAAEIYWALSALPESCLAK